MLDLILKNTKRLESRQNLRNSQLTYEIRVYLLRHKIVNNKSECGVIE